MNYWFIPGNEMNYDHFKSFKKNGYIDWIQDVNLEIKDIVYVYSSENEHRVKYKTVVEKTDIPYVEKTKDDQFWLKPDKLRIGNRYVRLRLLSVINTDALSYSRLVALGQKSRIENCERIRNEKMLAEIKRVFDAKEIVYDEDYAQYKKKKQEINSKDSFLKFAINVPGIKTEYNRRDERMSFWCNGIRFAEIQLNQDDYDLFVRTELLYDFASANYQEITFDGLPRCVVRGIPYEQISVLSGVFDQITKGNIDLELLESKDVEDEMRKLSDEVNEMKLEGKERDAYVKVRVNQSSFRVRLLRRYGKCCLCGINMKEMLIASHIKPWRDSNPLERIDVDNGLLLCANHDKLFDQGYITINDDDMIKLSESMEQYDLDFLNLNLRKSVDLTDGNRKYLKHHRVRVFNKKPVTYL